MRQSESFVPAAPESGSARDVAINSGAFSRVARGWAIVTIALMTFNLSLVAWYLVKSGDTFSFFSHQLLTPFLVVAYMALGVAVVGKRPRNPIGWLFLIVGSSYALSALAAGLRLYGNALPLTIAPFVLELSDWLNLWVWLPSLMLPITFLLLLFPDGHLLSPRWRPIAWAAGFGLGLTMIGMAFHPGPLEMWSTGPNPIGFDLAVPLLNAMLTLGMLLFGLGFFGSIAAVILRYQRSQSIEREQLKWLLLASLITVAIAVVLIPVWLGGGLSGPASVEISIVATNIVILGLATAATVAIVGYHLYDIDIFINRTLVYSVMTATIFLIYVLIVGGVGILLQSQGSWILALVATGIVAVLFQPLRDWLQRGVNRLLYGQRDEPFEVLAQLGQQLEQMHTTETIYPTIVETVASSLRLPFAALQEQTPGGFTTVFARGKPTFDTVSFPLTYQGEIVGRLSVGRRSPGETLSENDELLLRNIARQAGIAVYDTRLKADLQRSRQQLVTNREEERRRLRRDLHDGLGPSLASLLLESGVLRRMIRDDPSAAEALTEEIQGDIRATIEDVRRVVYELRPPALDDLGLVQALNVMAAKIGRPENGSTFALQVNIEAAHDLPPLPAAVEVAAYRIAQEALTNVVRHANASDATVRLRCDGDLHIEIADNGVGFNGGREGGLGLHSMRERTAELGGTWSIARQPGGGTMVCARLPLPGK